MSENSGNDCPLLSPAVSQSLTLVVQPPKEPPTPPPPVLPLCNEDVSQLGIPLPSTNGRVGPLPSLPPHQQPPLPIPPPPQIPPPPSYTPPQLPSVPSTSTTPPAAQTSFGSPMTIDGRVVCWDFLRGKCFRHPSKCRYVHHIVKDSIKFCHDFQNKLSCRPNCKFIHCTTDEENTFNKTGVLSKTILDKYFKNPVCEDCLRGNCARGDDCPFRLQRQGKNTKETKEERTPNNNILSITPPPPLAVDHAPIPRNISNLPPRGPMQPNMSPRPMGDHYLPPGSVPFSSSPRVYPPNISMPPPCPPNWRNQWVPPKQIKEDWKISPPPTRPETPMAQKRLWNGNEGPSIDHQDSNKIAELEASVAKATNSKNVILEQLIDLMKKPETVVSSISPMMNQPMHSSPMQSQQIMNSNLQPQQQIMQQQQPYQLVHVVAPTNSQSIRMGSNEQNHAMQITDANGQQVLTYSTTPISLPQQIQNGGQSLGQQPAAQRSMKDFLQQMIAEYGDILGQQRPQSQPAQQQQSQPHHQMMTMGQQTTSGHMMTPQTNMMQPQIGHQMQHMQQQTIIQQNPYSLSNMLPPH